MDNIAAITIAVFLAGVVFAAGRLTSRVESLEAWRHEMSKSLDSIHHTLRHLEHLIVTGEDHSERLS